MIQKQLHQIDWSRGQTDGDISQGFVARLLNVEIDVPGKLRPRGEMSYEFDIANPGSDPGYSYVHIPEDPSGSNPSGVLAILYDSRIEIVSMVSNSVIDTLTIGFTVDSTSYMISSSNKAYLIAHVDGEPAGVYIISNGAGGEMFSAPLSITSAHDMHNPVALSTDWQLSEYANEPPALILMNASSYDLVPAQLDQHGDNSAGLELSTLDDVGGVYIGECSIDYAVQYRYVDGSRSRLSNTITYDENQATAYSVGYLLALNANLSTIVAAVDIFRRIVVMDGEEIDDEFRLVESVPVIATSEIYNESVGYGAFADRWTIPSSSPIVGLSQTANPLGAPGDDTTVLRSTSASVSISSGWLFVDDGSLGCYFFAPKCCTAYGGNSTLSTFMGYVYNTYYDINVTGAVVIDSIESGIGNAVFVSEGHGLESPPQNLPTVGYRGLYGGGSAWSQYWNSNVFCVVEATSAQISALSSYGNLYEAVDVPSLSYFPKLVSADAGDRGTKIVTYLTLNGVSELSSASVKPYFMALAGARAFCLNVDVDGERKRSMMMFSEYNNIGVFSPNNYIDFSGRNTGDGIAVVEYKGRLLVLHQFHSAILDISGGSSISWREIGTFPGYGCAGRHLVALSPMGAFFGNKDDAFYFDGNKVQPITTIPQIGLNVQDTYRALYASGISAFVWNKKRNQLMIFGGKSCLVVDILTMAWHEHYYEEMPSFYEVGGMFVIDDDTYFVLISDQGFTLYSEQDPGSTLPFTWGMDTGSLDLGAPEIVKKMKRLYIDTIGESGTSGDMSIYIDGDVDPAQQVSPGEGRAMNRLRVNARGHTPTISVMFEKEGVVESWSGVIESLGLSYKPKPLK